MKDVEVLAAAMGYTKASLEGIGALKGAPCQIQSITPITGGNRVTFLWVDDSEVEHTSTMDVMDGSGGDAIWGSITGTLSNQTDLQTALNAKATMGEVVAYVNQMVLGGAD